MGQIERFIKIKYINLKRQKWRIQKEKYRKQEEIKGELTLKRPPLKLELASQRVRPTCTTVLTGTRVNFITEVIF
tara:strand:- start:1678 stop:1902 length:225 start_codon:yes stop_codon:yes gene_type:complete